MIIIKYDKQYYKLITFGKNVSYQKLSYCLQEI